VLLKHWSVPQQGTSAQLEQLAQRLCAVPASLTFGSTNNKGPASTSSVEEARSHSASPQGHLAVQLLQGSVVFRRALKAAPRDAVADYNTKCTSVLCSLVARVLYDAM